MAASILALLLSALVVWRSHEETPTETQILLGKGPGSREGGVGEESGGSRSSEAGGDGGLHLRGLLFSIGFCLDFVWNCSRRLLGIVHEVCLLHVHVSGTQE